jgi:hypothetical protein
MGYTGAEKPVVHIPVARSREPTPDGFARVSIFMPQDCVPQPAEPPHTPPNPVPARARSGEQAIFHPVYRFQRDQSQSWWAHNVDSVKCCLWAAWYGLIDTAEAVMVGCDRLSGYLQDSWQDTKNHRNPVAFAFLLVAFAVGVAAGRSV